MRHNRASALIGIQGPEAASAWAEADRLLDESIPLQKEVHGADSDQAGMELMLRARLRGRQGRKADALGALNEGIAIVAGAILMGTRTWRSVSTTWGSSR